MKRNGKARSTGVFIPAVEAAEAVAALLQRRQPVLFLCGAGISYAPPASAPLWPALRDGLLAAFLERLAAAGHLTEQEVKKTLASVADLATTNKLWIKPEVAMHWFHRTFRDELFGAFSVLQQGTPNSNHQILAALAKGGFISSLLTTNFDLYLESALAAVRADFRVFAGESVNGDTSPLTRVALAANHARVFRLVKVHGTLTQTETIQATLEQVGHQFPDAISKRLATLVRKHHVVVVGYSGNDYDVFPFLQREAPRMASLTWLYREPTGLHPDVPKLRCDIRLTAGDVNRFFRMISSVLKLPPVTRSKAVRRRQPCAESAELLGKWASNRDELLVAYTLSLFARHIGLSEFTQTMCRIGRKLSTVWECRFLNVQGLALRRKSPKDAMKLYLRAERLARSFRTTVPATYSNVAGNIGSLLHETGRHGEALQWLQISNRWARRAENWRATYGNDDDIGNCLRALGRVKAAVRYHLRAIRYQRANSNLIALPLALNNLGLAYEDLKNYRAAYRVLTESVELKRKETADVPALTRGLLALGIASARLGKYDEALKHFREGLRLAPVAEDDVTATHIQYELAALYQHTGEKALAVRCYKTAERMAGKAPLWTEDRYRMKQIAEIKALFRFTN